MKASTVRDLLYRLVGFVWVSQDVGNAAVFIKQFRQRLIDYSIQSWHSDMEFASKLNLYTLHVSSDHRDPFIYLPFRA